MFTKLRKNLKPTDLEERIQTFEVLASFLMQSKNIQEKLQILNQQTEVKEFFLHFHGLRGYLKKIDEESELVIKSVIALGQGSLLFDNAIESDETDFQNCLKVLLDIQKFYESLGGIVGYHLTVLKLITAKNEKCALSENVCYDQPVGIELSQDTLEVRKLVRWGLEALPTLSEIYPVGGAGDRLDLHDDRSGEALPVAVLLFCGRPLLEGLVRDLQAREYIYYKMYHAQVAVPIVMMTSHEKNNHRHILSICEKSNWFGRPKEGFRLFVQTLVPVITIEGDWVVHAPLQLVLKPGGHGVIWKFAQESGVFDWLDRQNKLKAVVRQINNPIAGVDNGLIAFSGFGYHYDKSFGYASCQRILNTSEGMDVLVETRTTEGYEYRLSNLEYTEFEQKGVSDVPAEPGSPYSVYPANTNILFVDLEAIKIALLKCPIPGMLINMKTAVSVFDEQGVESQISAGRLESTMQNIADYITDTFSQRLEKPSPYDLRAFITFNERNKTISVVKKAYKASNPIHETPEGCFYEMHKNHYTLFTHFCNMQLPALNDEKTYLEQGPSFLIDYHPALGPLYAIIGQKIQGGTLASGSEMQLEVAELKISNLYLDGSLLIFADQVMGSKKEDGLLEYNESSGKCVLSCVRVENGGIDRGIAHRYWKHEIVRRESLRITLRGNAEFFAENVTFKGDFNIEVPCGHRMIASMHQNQVQLDLEKIERPSWHWKYAFDSEERIALSLIHSSR